MKKLREWTQPARYLVLTMVALSLTIGLCSMGPAFDTKGTLAQIISAWLGIVCFFCFLAFLFTTIGTAVQAIVKRMKE